MERRKLIEVALPLEAINREAAREKSIRHGHPSTVHLWWARRPLAAARAVLFAQLVDDPSSRPEEFPTEEEQTAERARLHAMIERLVVWENTRDEKLLGEAHAEILKSTDGNPPPILDPFAGGGTIPLEAQRLGLAAHASDLNPVAVLINKALIEIPPKFADRPPIFPGLGNSAVELVKTEWRGAEGLAADVRAYGEWMRDRAKERIGRHYPDATLDDGTKATVIAWIWARTVTCPNPACGIEMPLVRSWRLGKKKGKEAYVVPRVVADPNHPSAKRVAFEIGHDLGRAPTAATDGTVGRNGATCIACTTGVELKHIREEGRNGRLGASLMATVAEGNRRRVYVAPDAAQADSARVEHPESAPDQRIPPRAPSFRVQAYGMTKWADLFTDRQLLALTTFSDLVAEAREQVLRDAVAAGMSEGGRLEDGGTGAAAYADAVGAYLGLAVGRSANKNSAICGWDSSAKMEAVRSVFARQALPMVWDFAEANAFAASSGSFVEDCSWVAMALERVPAGHRSTVMQEDASTRQYVGSLISTDPPYYDNIGYSDLSDFFYVWQRRTLKDVLPSLFRTVLVPKTEELVANPYRHDGKEGAKRFFEGGFREVFARARQTALPDFPITVYYAFKQSDSDDDGASSSGWETLLEGMIRSGWAITATWPMRSELSNRMIAKDTNALASSIVLALRPRPDDARSIDRRGFIGALRTELVGALDKLQQGGIAPVDLPQAAIGPGMAVFSRYSGVIESDGSKMSVRSALARINEILDEVLADQEGDFDATTRFAIAWYRQNAYTTGAFGDANNLANARNTSVSSLDRDGVLVSRAGKVNLIRPADLPWDYDVTKDSHCSVWEATHHAIRILESEGIQATGAFLTAASARPEGDVDAELLPELAHLLFRVSQEKGWTKESISFNGLVTSWPQILDAARSASPPPTSAQPALDFGDQDS